MLKTNPAVVLGPRYSIRYVWPFPEGRSVIYQDIYPYAKPYPVTYMKPGQPLWGAASADAPARRDGQHTFGGWYVSTGELRLALEAIAATPSAPDDGGLSFGEPKIVGLLGGMAVTFTLFGLALVARRRRMGPTHGLTR